MSDGGQTRRAPVALVTGASRGIGREIAMLLSQRGFDVGLIARSSSELETLATGIAATGRQAVAAPADVCDERQVEDAVNRVATTFGGIDAVINSAGVDLDRRLEETTLDEWEHVLRTNLTSAFLVLRAASSHLFESDRGRVVNISSIFAVAGVSRWSAYSAAKGGLLSLTRTLAIEWARHGVRVNAILAGNIETEMTAAALAVPKMRELVLSRTPARRIGLPRDVAAMAAYLVSEEADFVTGQALAVDGGFTAW